MAILLRVEEDPAVRSIVEQAAAALGQEVTLVASVAEAVDAASRHPIDVVVWSEGAGRDLGNPVEPLRRLPTPPPVVIVSTEPSVEGAVAAMHAGASDYLASPLTVESMKRVLRRAIDAAPKRREPTPRPEHPPPHGERAIVGESPGVLEMLRIIDAVAPTRASVLLRGESGTGKELVAREIHARSPRRDRAFVAVSGAAVPEGLVEGALFGHEGAGPGDRVPGAFERAHQGTLYVDEVADLRLDLQAKLLRAIQEEEVERGGASLAPPSDVRIIAATQRDLESEVEAGRFHRALYYQLNVVAIDLPPLRERPGDIPLLVDHFVRRFAAELGRRPPTVTPAMLLDLQRQPWPGNIRELANAVERAMILSRGEELVALVAPSEGARRSARAASQAPGGRFVPAPPVETVGDPRRMDPEMFDLRRLERIMIARALEYTGGHRSRAADLLGINERTLRNKLKAGSGSS